MAPIPNLSVLIVINNDKIAGRLSDKDYNAPSLAVKHWVPTQNFKFLEESILLAVLFEIMEGSLNFFAYRYNQIKHVHFFYAVSHLKRTQISILVGPH